MNSEIVSVEEKGNVIRFWLADKYEPKAKAIYDDFVDISFDFDDVVVKTPYFEDPTYPFTKLNSNNKKILDDIIMGKLPVLIVIPKETFNKKLVMMDADSLINNPEVRKYYLGGERPDSIFSFI